MIDPGRFIEQTTNRHAQFYFRAVQDLHAAIIMRNVPMQVDARQALGNAIRETLGMGEIIGATLALREVAEVLAAEHPDDYTKMQRGRFARFAAEPQQNIVPRVPFKEALDGFVERVPETLTEAAERTAQRIAELYSEGNVVAFVRAAEASVTEHAQKFIAQALREGLPAGDAGRALAMSVNEVRDRSQAWSESYSRMVFRTNANTAVTAGRFRQAQDSIVRRVTPMFRFSTTRDVDVRENHKAAEGVIMKPDNPAWNFLAPPLGYNCRCRVSLMSRPRLRRAGLLDGDGNLREILPPFGAKPDAGFRHGGRPDLFLTGAAR